jgi:hypothetical protein
MIHFKTVIQYNLSDAKRVCYKAVKKALKEQPRIFTEAHLKQIVAMIKDTTECRSELFGPLKAHLPKTITDKQANILLDNDMLLTMITISNGKVPLRTSSKRKLRSLGPNDRLDRE